MEKNVIMEQKKTNGGGFLSRDIMQGLGPNEYFIRNAYPGKYEISANYYSNYQQSLTGATIVSCKIWKNFGRENEECQATISRITRQGETVPLASIIIPEKNESEEPEKRKIYTQEEINELIKKGSSNELDKKEKK